MFLHVSHLGVSCLSVCVSTSVVGGRWSVGVVFSSIRPSCESVYRHHNLAHWAIHPTGLCLKLVAVLWSHLLCFSQYYVCVLGDPERFYDLVPSFVRSCAANTLLCCMQTTHVLVTTHTSCTPTLTHLSVHTHTHTHTFPFRANMKKVLLTVFKGLHNRI